MKITSFIRKMACNSCGKDRTYGSVYDDVEVNALKTYYFKSDTKESTTGTHVQGSTIYAYADSTGACRRRLAKFAKAAGIAMVIDFSAGHNLQYGHPHLPVYCKGTPLYETSYSRPPPS